MENWKSSLNRRFRNSRPAPAVCDQSSRLMGSVSTDCLVPYRTGTRSAAARWRASFYNLQL